MPSGPGNGQGLAHHDAIIANIIGGAQGLLGDLVLAGDAGQGITGLDAMLLAVLTALGGEPAARRHSGAAIRWGRYPRALTVAEVWTHFTV